MRKSFPIIVFLAFCLTLSFSSSAKPYKGAEIYSKQSFKYGRYEMRMRVAKGSGVLSTFFTYKNGSEQPGVFWEEIDIEVFGKNNATQWQSNVIIGTNRPTSKTEGVHTMPFSLGDGYNTYVLEWTPTYIAWFINDTEVRRINGGQFVSGLANPQSLRFNLWAANIPEWVGAWSDHILPIYQFVNYFEYRPWIPATNSFGAGWRDDFNSFDSNLWGKADWTFGENLVDFEPNNALVKNGILVLALTREGQTGFTGTPPVDKGIECLDATISSKVEAEAYCSQSGTQTEPTTDVGGGENVGWIDSGDSLTYGINVPVAGTYTIKYRVASLNNGAFFNLQDQSGANIYDVVQAEATGGWQNWVTVTKTVNLPAGSQKLVIKSTGAGWNINWFDISQGGSGSSSSSSSSSSIMTFPCNSGNSTNSGGNPTNVMQGSCVAYTMSPWGNMQLGSWNVPTGVRYDVRNCNGAIIKDVAQLQNAFTTVKTGTNGCTHYIHVKQASSPFTLQFGSW